MSALPIDLVAIELEEPSDGAFVLGLSEVGDDLSPEGAAMEWFPVTCETTSLAVDRGGQVDGPSTSIDVGTLALRYAGGPDPATDARIRPGVGCRLTVPIAPADEWSTSWGFETGDGSPTVTATDVDLPRDGDALDGSPSWTVHADAARTGAGGGIANVNTDDLDVPGRARFTWTQTGLVRGGRYRLAFWFRRVNGSIAVSVGYGGDHALDVSDRWSYGWEADPAGWAEHAVEFTAVDDSIDLHVEVYAYPTGDAQLAHLDDFSIERIPAVLYTGTIEDVAAAYDDERTYTRLSGVDAVRALTSTPRSGAVTDGDAGHESWQNRAGRLLLSSPVPYVRPSTRYPTSWENAATGWSTFGTVPSGQSASTIHDGDGGYWRLAAPTVAAGTAVTYTAGSYGVERTLTGLVVGRRYVIVWPLWLQTTWPQAVVSSDGDPEGHLYYAVGVDDTWGEPFRVPTAVGDLAGIRWPIASFVATDTTATLRLARWFTGTVRDRGDVSFYPEAVHAFGPYVHGWLADDQPVVDTPHETNLANHLQIVADSAGAAWWVDRHGSVVMAERHGRQATGWHLSDDPADHDTPGHVCIAEAEIAYDTRHAVSVVRTENLAARQERQNAEDVADYRTVVVESGSYLYGRREGRLTTTLPLGHIEARAAELFTAPAVTVETVTFDAGAYPFAACLDVGDVVTVTSRGATATYAAIGIRHTLTPKRWLCRLTLRPEET